MGLCTCPLALENEILDELLSNLDSTIIENPNASTIISKSGFSQGENSCTEEIGIGAKPKKIKRCAEHFSDVDLDLK